jgi:hypothetical protein
VAYCRQVCERAPERRAPCRRDRADGRRVLHAGLRRMQRPYELVRRSGPPFHTLRERNRVFDRQVKAVSLLRNRQEHVDGAPINGEGWGSAAALCRTGCLSRPFEIVDLVAIAGFGAAPAQVESSPHRGVAPHPWDCQHHLEHHQLTAGTAEPCQISQLTDRLKSPANGC